MIERDEGGEPACWAHLFEDEEVGTGATEQVPGRPDGRGDDGPMVTSIHVAPASRLPMRAVESVTAEAGAGLVGDRYHGTRHRHVTIQSQAGLDEATVSFGAPVDPALTRRNLTISHGEIPTTPGAHLQVGEVWLEVVRVAAPCKLLDDTIGTGARDALRRRAGSVCRVLSSGTISVGDLVELDTDVLDSADVGPG